MRKLSPNRRSDLRHLLGRTEPIEPRHQRCVQACRDRQSARTEPRRRCCRASPSLSASSTAFVISSTNSGMPSVRSIMSCRILCGERLIAGDAVDHGSDFALPEPIDGEGGNVGSSNPRRLELRPDRSRSAAREGLRIRSTFDRSASRLVGSIQCASSKIINTGFGRDRVSTCAVSASSVLCRRCCGVSSSVG